MHNIGHPFYFKSFGEYKNPITIYSTIPFIYLFGLNEFGVRIASLFFSFLTVICFFLLGKELKNERFGVILALLFSIAPWSFHLSTTNMESYNQLIFLIVLSLFVFIKFINTKEDSYLLLLSVILGAAVYTYFSSRIIIPGIAIFYFLFICLKFRNIKYIGYLLLFIIICLPLIQHTLSGEGLSRFKDTSVFNLQIDQFIVKFVKTYIMHFSPDYLIFNGDGGMKDQLITRHSILGIGQLGILFIPLVFIGFYSLIKKKNWNIFLIIIFMLIIYPIPSSITQEIPPQATRSFQGIVPFVLLSGYGFDYLLKRFRKYKELIKISFYIAVFLSFSNLIQLYYAYPLKSSDFWGWQYGPKQIINYYKTINTKFDDVFMAGEFNAASIFLKFYDPNNECYNCKIGDLTNSDTNKNQIFALSTKQFNNSKMPLNIVKIINYPDKSPAFYIVTIKY